MKARWILGTAGILLAGYGAWGLAAHPAQSHPVALLVWLAVGVGLHDGVIAPVTIGIGMLLGLVPALARAHLQAVLIVAGLIALPAVLLVVREGSQPAAKGLESQNYGLHLVVLGVLIVIGGLVSYGIDRWRRGDRLRAE